MKKKGICMVCACTHDDPCDEGCGWANVKQTLCTACAPLSPAERAEKKAASIEQLEMELEIAEDVAAQLRTRLDVLEGVPGKPGGTNKRTEKQKPLYRTGGLR